MSMTTSIVIGYMRNTYATVSRANYYDDDDDDAFSYVDYSTERRSIRKRCTKRNTHVSLSK